MDLRAWGAAWALLLAAGASAQSDEDEKRPYKFAFNIEGYQHRSEEKDERGIIKGEYGFVTGDGVYHVTVYATDENGDFHVLSMKNYYIGLPGQGTTAAPNTTPRPMVTRPPPPSTYPTTSTTVSPIINHLNGLMGCSGCIIPEKNMTKQTGSFVPRPKPESGEGVIDERVEEKDQLPNFSTKTPGGKFTSEKPNTEDQTYIGVEYVPFDGDWMSSTTPCSDCGVSSAVRPSSGHPVGDFPDSKNTYGPNYKPGTAGDQGQKDFQSPAPSSESTDNPPPPKPIAFGDVITFKLGDDEPEKPGYSSPDDNSVDKINKSPKNTPMRPSQSTEDRFSPGGINRPTKPGIVSSSDQPSSGEMTGNLLDLFYKFNYTQRYHGHHESGYRNGDKEGGYFFNGRDGQGRSVKYVANEFGFQPNISLVDLGLQNPDTPKERDEQPDELRGYEFQWFYQR